MYLIYQDEKGVKVARQDGRLDEYTKYYPTQSQAIIQVGGLGLKVVENDAPH